MDTCHADISKLNNKVGRNPWNPEFRPATGNEDRKLRVGINTICTTTTERRVESVCRTSGESPGHIDTNTPGGAMQN